MREFVYSAITKTGDTITGTVQAGDVKQAIAQLRAKQIYPIKIDAQRAKTGEKVWDRLKSKPIAEITLWGQTVKAKQFLPFLRQLSALIRADVPLVKALDILAVQQGHGYLRTVITSLSEDVQSGKLFSESLQRFPKVFNALFVSMVRVGELSGSLGDVLARLVVFRERREDVVNRIRSALVYPTVVLGLAAVIVIVLLTFVIPRFEQMFVQLKVSLPLPTLILISVSSALHSAWWLIGIAALGLGVLLRMMSRLSRFRLLFFKLQVRLPFVGAVVLKMHVIQFTRTLGTLLASGVPILKALTILEETMLNDFVAREMRRLHDHVEEGGAVADGLKRSILFPSLVVDMIRVGEETGQLDKMLLSVSDMYELELDLGVSNSVKLIEPILIVCMSVTVGYIVVSLFLPLISLLDALGT